VFVLQAVTSHLMTGGGGRFSQIVDLFIEIWKSQCPANWPTQGKSITVTDVFVKTVRSWLSVTENLNDYHHLLLKAHKYIGLKAVK